MNPLKAQIEASVAAEIIRVFAGEDEETMWDAVRAGCNFEEMIAAAVKLEADDDMLEEAIAARIAELTERKGRFKNRRERTRSLISALLSQAGVRKVELAEATLSIGNAPQSVRIIDEAALPTEYLRIKKEPDKTAIKDALKRGDSVLGAELSNGGETLTIRRK